ncbi:MAG: lipoprotein N-acyltransferase Lnb domain-containing protein [Polaribacter sp.]
MYKKLLFLNILCFFFFIKTKAQIQLSKYAEISIVTAAPGAELYESFGHAAIRIKDPVLNFDYIYNYGIFDFNTPNFYSNFAKGNMYYLLARYNFNLFLRDYKRDKRWVKQQTLNLTSAEKQTFFAYLETNAQPKNATYLYDPFFNNCATKLRDITATILGDKITFGDDAVKKNNSLRVLMNNKLHWNTWGSFGINLITGIILDKKRMPSEYMYLPDYVYRRFKHGTINRNGKIENLVQKEDLLLTFNTIKSTPSFISPMLVFILFMFLVLVITYKDIQRKKRSKRFDF